jgi:hypothetical protein
VVVNGDWVFKCRWDSHAPQFDVEAFLVVTLLPARTNLAIDCLCFAYEVVDRESRHDFHDWSLYRLLYESRVPPPLFDRLCISTVTRNIYRSRTRGNVHVMRESIIFAVLLMGCDTTMVPLRSIKPFAVFAGSTVANTGLKTKLFGQVNHSGLQELY